MLYWNYINYKVKLFTTLEQSILQFSKIEQFEWKNWYCPLGNSSFYKIFHQLYRVASIFSSLVRHSFGSVARSSIWSSVSFSLLSVGMAWQVRLVDTLLSYSTRPVDLSLPILSCLYFLYVYRRYLVTQHHIFFASFSFKCCCYPFLCFR